MLIFLYGEEIFLVKKKLQEFILHHQKKYPERVNFFRLNASETSLPVFCNAVRQPSLFTSIAASPRQKRFVIIEDIGKEKDLIESIANHIEGNRDYYIPETSPVILLFVEYGAPKKDNPLLLLCEKEGKVSVHPKLDPRKRKAVFKNMWEEMGMSIGWEALQYFDYCVGGDLWRASNEIEKYSTVKKGSEHCSVTVQDIRSLLAPLQELNTFFLIDAFSQKQKKEALAAWSRLIEQGSEPLALVGSLLWQLRNLLLMRAAIDSRLRSNDIIRELGLHPFVARKSYEQAKFFSLEELKKLYEKVFWLDVDIKRGRQDAMGGFEGIVVNL